MDSFGVDPGSLQEAARVTNELESSLAQQIRDTERLISLQAQVRGIGARRGMSAVQSDLDLQPVAESGDPFLLQPSKNDRSQIDLLVDQAIRKRAEPSQTAVDWKLRTQLFGNAPIPTGKEKKLPTEFDMSRHDVRAFRGLIRLAMGDVDYHTVKESVEAGAMTDLGQKVGLGKLAEKLSNAAGPAMLAQFVMSVATQIYESRTQDLHAVSRGFIESAKAARSVGIGEEAEGQIRRQSFGRVFVKRLKESKQKITGIGFLDDAWNKVHNATEYFIHGRDKITAEAEAEAAQAIELVGRATGSPEFLASIGITGATGSNLSSTRRMQLLDEITANHINEAKHFFAREDELKRMKRANDMPIERDRKSNPLLDAQLRNTESLMKATEKQLAMQKQDWNKE